MKKHFLIALANALMDLQEVLFRWVDWIDARIPDHEWRELPRPDELATQTPRDFADEYRNRVHLPRRQPTGRAH